MKIKKGSRVVIIKALDGYMDSAYLFKRGKVTREANVGYDWEVKFDEIVFLGDNISREVEQFFENELVTEEFYDSPLNKALE